ncbi:hypothetical protein [Alistipes sp.]|uniref:Arm DNA-binding domain-containing protein n=1 Tax=Alistipes sp. TaxID=1872444 RepID=UPI0025BB70CB|nr:hypothetical protein [Alistipes sp.]
MLPRTTFSVVFFCKKTKVTKKGKAPIYARITTTGQSTEVYTQCQIEPERWNQRLERCSTRMRLTSRSTVSSPATGPRSLPPMTG